MRRALTLAVLAVLAVLATTPTISAHATPAQAENTASVKAVAGNIPADVIINAATWRKWVKNAFKTAPAGKGVNRVITYTDTTKTGTMVRIFHLNADGTLVATYATQAADRAGIDPYTPSPSTTAAGVLICQSECWIKPPGDTKYHPFARSRVNMIKLEPDSLLNPRETSGKRIPYAMEGCVAFAEGKTLSVTVNTCDGHTSFTVKSKDLTREVTQSRASKPYPTRTPAPLGDPYPGDGTTEVFYIR